MGPEGSTIEGGKMRGSSLRWRPSAGTAIAMVALFLALGGTAAALHGHNRVKAGDLAKHAVGHRNIRPGAVHTGNLRFGAATSQKVDVVRSKAIGTANATNSTKPTNLGGPVVKTTVPPGALVEVYAQAQISVTGGNTASVGLFAPGVVSHAPTILSSQSSRLTTHRTAPGVGAEGGVAAASRAGYLTFAPPSGHHTFALSYKTTGGTATFQNRSLFVRVIR
jgi:hypothetical protein